MNLKHLMMIAFISGKVVSHNRDRCPIIHSVLMIAESAGKLTFITHVLEAIINRVKAVTSLVSHN